MASGFITADMFITSNTAAAPDWGVQGDPSSLSLFSAQTAYKHFHGDCALMCLTQESAFICLVSHRVSNTILAPEMPLLFGAACRAPSSSVLAELRYELFLCRTPTCQPGYYSHGRSGQWEGVVVKSVAL